MSKPTITFVGCSLLLSWLGGCAVPSPYAGAPVVDRSVYRQTQQPAQQPQPSPPKVQVTPLERPSPLTSEPVEQQVTMAEPPKPEPRPRTAPPPAPEPTPAPEPPSEPEGNKAVVALLDSAANHVVNNELDQAAASLERALRIEPRNATIWHDLGQVRLHQRKYDQAEAMFEKSNSLAGSDNALEARNWRMIAASRRAAGNSAGADAAEARAVTLER